VRPPTCRSSGSTVAKASGPLTRMMPRPPMPGGVAIAAIVSFCIDQIIAYSLVPVHRSRQFSSQGTCSAIAGVWMASPYLHDAVGVGVHIHRVISQEADEGNSTPIG